MSERGVFAVDRGIWSDPDFAKEPFTEREAFLWLVGEAAWRPTRVRVGSASIDLQRGQCAFSTRFLAAKWQWSEARVRRFFKRLCESQIIDARADARSTQITICNYDKFQRVGLPIDAVSDASPTHPRRSSDAKKKQGNRSSSLRSEDPPLNASDPSISDPGPLTEKPKASRSSRIAADAQPDETDRRSASEAGMDGPTFRHEWALFRDHHIARATLSADWNASWRTWVGKWVSYGAKLIGINGHANGARAGPAHSSQLPLDDIRNPMLRAGKKYFETQS